MDGYQPRTKTSIDILDMVRQNASSQGRYGIGDLLDHAGMTAFPLIVIGKGLKTGALANRQWAVFLIVDQLPGRGTRDGGRLTVAMKALEKLL